MSNPAAPAGPLAKAATSWGTASVTSATPTYDPKQFYCRATDTKGHGEKLVFKVPPEIYAQVQRLVHSEVFPNYTMPMEFARDAIVHHLVTRAAQIDDPSLRDDVHALVERLAFKEYIAAAEEARADWAAMEESFRELCTGLARDGAWAHLWELLDKTEDFVDGIAEPYRSQVLTTVTEWRTRVPAAFRP